MLADSRNFLDGHRWGADFCDWKAAVDLGITADLLPCVSRPDMPILTGSTLRGAYQKVPCRYMNGRRVVGIANWPTKVSTAREVESWAREADYGLAIQTRRLRALDLDIPDATRSAEILEAIQTRTARKEWPRRLRPNTGKCLLPLWLPADPQGDFHKRVLRLESGLIEFLASGQHFVAAGTHSRSSRYRWSTWDGSLPTGEEIPTFDRAEFEALWAWLCETFGGGNGGSSQPVNAPRSTVRSEAIQRDALARALQDRGLIRRTRSDGGLDVACPWGNEHTSEGAISEATYWPAHTGGYSGGGFKCMHAHCADRTIADLKTLLLGESAEPDELSTLAPEVAAEVRAASADTLFLPSDHMPAHIAADRIFRKLGEAGELFRRGSAVVERNKSEHIAIVTAAALRSRLWRHGRKVRGFKVDNHGNIIHGPKQCSDDQARLLINCLEVDRLPEISLVSKFPVLIERNGELRTTRAGYDPESGVLTTSEIQLPAISLDVAATALRDLLQDFKFAEPSDEARALASLIAPAIRMSRLLPGDALITSVEADKSQAGKGFMLKLIRAIYGERPYVVAQRKGGVGGLDESLAQALLSGAPFVVLDNLRGRLDSPFLESAITAGGDLVAVRVPHRGEVRIDIGRTLFQLTSNGVEGTVDLANRILLIRLRKQPAGHRFATFDEGDLLRHVEAWRARYLAAVHAVVRFWYAAERPTLDTEHSFRRWVGSLDWIVQNVWQTGPLMDGHAQAVSRIADPGLSWLRQLALVIVTDGKAGQELLASELFTLGRDHDLYPPQVRPDCDDASGFRAIGRVMSRLFAEADSIDLDGLRISRVERDERDEWRNVETLRYYRIDRKAGAL